MIRRGEIWWAALANPRGSEPGFERPVLIVQSDPFNRSRIQTVMAAILTSNLNLSNAPGNVALPMSETGLPRDSVVNVSQVVTLDKGFLLEKAGRLSRKRLEAVDDGLRLALGL